MSSRPNHGELDEIIGTLLELRSLLRKLQWYGEVNRRGIMKITKKLDKKVPRACVQQQYVKTRLEPKHFANNSSLGQDMNEVNEWLSKLGESKSAEDTCSSPSSSSLSVATSASTINVTERCIELIDRAIREDDAASLQGVLVELQKNEGEESQSLQRFQRNILQRAITAYRRKCVALMLRLVEILDDEEDINGRNAIHRFVITVGRWRTRRETEGIMSQAANHVFNGTIVPAEAPNFQNPVFALKENGASPLLDSADNSLRFLRFILDNLTPVHRTSLNARDNFGCLPLHYAAQTGLSGFCEVIMNRMRSWDFLNIRESIDSDVWFDKDNNSPLHLSVIGGHVVTTRCLLDACKPRSGPRSRTDPDRQLSISSNLLAVATRSNFCKILKLLVQAGADLDFQDQWGETALHVAARFGYTECAQILLAEKKSAVVNLDVQENIFGWSPLHVASVDGQLSMVRLLVEKGADPELKDESGWTAKEHAALRGYLTISSLLATSTSQPQSSHLPFESSKDHALKGKDRQSGAKLEEAPPTRQQSLVKSFGHRYLRSESMVLISLGSMDQRKATKPVKLDNIPIAAAHATQLDTALSLVVSATSAHGEPSIIDLPVQESICTDPIAFTTIDVSNVKIMFDLIPTYAGSKDKIVGRGVAVVSNLIPTIGLKRSNLQADVSVPIVAAKTLEYIGAVNFSFLVITPFSHPNMSITESSTYWKSLTSPMVIGHRGLGKNMASRKSLQLGENTIESFIAAANLGASYVEFDVQLTKDHVPVIYHDFLVSESGIDAPVHTMTLEQFLHVNETHSSGASQPKSPQRNQRSSSLSRASNSNSRYDQRANSLGSTSLSSSKLSDRMKHTRDYKTKGYKGNSRGNTIQAPFTTLEEMFLKLPPTIGFNIEMKYPMLFESEEEGMDTYAVELNSFVDTVLAKVYELGRGRDIIFSSFNPDICLLLSLKQPSVPVLFLTDAGTSEVGDVRASSLQEAIRFASRWNLLGIVSAAEPLVACPRLVRVVKESGLVCVSYGTLNNDPAHVKVSEALCPFLEISKAKLRLRHKSMKASMQ